MEWKRGEILELVQNKKAEKNRDHIQINSIYSDSDHSYRMVLNQGGG